mmetsp:Transcript_29964/g.77339  ORF Transcript_29964/g.77339 Transcript_29964/m.77339 type:complete len:104 (+) Transcript_29964:2086-2397(+)
MRRYLFVSFRFLPSFEQKAQGGKDQRGRTFLHYLHFPDDNIVYYVLVFHFPLPPSLFPVPRTCVFPTSHPSASTASQPQKFRKLVFSPSFSTSPRASSTLHSF